MSESGRRAVSVVLQIDQGSLARKQFNQKNVNITLVISLQPVYAITVNTVAELINCHLLSTIK